MSDKQIEPASGEGDVLDALRAELEDSGDERPPAGGPFEQVLAAVVVLAVGIFGATRSLSYGLGELTQPGPGLWPFVVSVLIVVLAIALLVWGRELADAEAFTRSSAQPLIGVMTFVALAALMPVVGFEIPSFLLAVVWLRFLGGESWRSTLLVAAGTVAAFYLVFVIGLSIPMPRLG